MSVSSFSGLTPKYLRLKPTEDDVVIVYVAVELLTEDVNLEHFGHELFALVEQFGCRRLVVDLHEVRVVTSAGLGKMITLHRKMHRHKIKNPCNLLKINLLQGLKVAGAGLEPTTFGL